jgi:ApaG protein
LSHACGCGTPRKRFSSAQRTQKGVRADLLAEHTWFCLPRTSPNYPSALQCRVSSLRLDTFTHFMPASLALPGLTARLEKLVYHHGGKCLPADQPHAFVYFISIQNASDHTVTLLGRKWVIATGDGSRQVIEGDKIVGETPRLSSGESFSYNSYHIAATDSIAQGSFHGVDDLGRAIHVILPSFAMRIPHPNPTANEEAC